MPSPILLVTQAALILALGADSALRLRPRCKPFAAPPRATQRGRK